MGFEFHFDGQETQKKSVQKQGKWMADRAFEKAQLTAIKHRREEDQKIEDVYWKDEDATIQPKTSR